MTPHCEPFEINQPDGSTVRGFVCGARYSNPKCCCCLKPDPERQCDWPMGRGKTCDRFICLDCTFHPEGRPDVDYCPQHKAMWLASRGKSDSDKG